MNRRAGGATAAEETVAGGHLFDQPRQRTLALAAWTIAFVLSVLLIAAVGFTSRDPDSTVYAGIAARLAQEPPSRWVAPEWWGQWGFAGPFREHPIGILVLPAAAARAGYPAEQAAYAVHGLYQILTLVLIAQLAAFVASRPEARALAWVLQLLPIAFVFRIRANQEYAVLAGMLLAMYATERSRTRAGWTVVTAAAFAWTLLVKGVFGFLTPLACAVWLFCRERTDGGRHGLLPWLGLGAMVLVAPALAWGYESWYRHVTGDSFFAFYAGPRLNPDAVAEATAGRVAYNAVWYTGRLIWYAFPWSLIALVVAAASLVSWRRGSRRRGDIGGPSLVRSGFQPGESPRYDMRPWGAFAFAALISAAMIVLMSFADRKADRFIFPAYFFVAGVGGVAAARWSPAFARLVHRLDRPWVPAAVWLALFLLRLATGSHLPQLTFWRS